MPEEDDKLYAAILDTIPKLLMAMELYEQVISQVNPKSINKFSSYALPHYQDLSLALAKLNDLQFPESLKAYLDTINQSCTYALRALAPFAHPNDDQDMMFVMKSMRAYCRSQEYIYSLASVFSPVNQFFLEHDQRIDTEFLEQFTIPSVQDEPKTHGIFNFSQPGQEERYDRGGFILYVPENLDLQTPRPLVIALHGGMGHGTDFLWSWFREARSRGFILMAPTSQSDTWCLDGPEEGDRDYEILRHNLEHVMSEWKIDDQHIMLAGMSDGATYALLAGLRENTPFTHLAAFSGVLHPGIVSTGQISHAKGRSIFLTHGDEDWMFPVEMAHMAKNELTNAGAEILYTEVEGLSHSFARAELPGLFKWFSSKET